MTMTMTVTVNEVWDLRLGICTWNCETHVCVERLDLTRVHHSLSLTIKQNEKCCCKKKKKRKEKKIRRNTCTHRMLSVVRAVVLSDLNVMIKPQPDRCKWQCNQFWKSFTADPPLSLTRLIKVRALSETCTRFTYLTGLHSNTTIERK